MNVLKRINRMLRAEMHALMDDVQDRETMLQRAMEGMRKALAEEERKLRRLDAALHADCGETMQSERQILAERLRVHKSQYANLALRVEYTR